jgi:hypothetical protein
MLDFYFHHLMTVQTQLTHTTLLILSSSALHLLLILGVHTYITKTFVAFVVLFIHQ